MQRLGHVHQTVPAVHIAGTNGKGSVASLSAEVLRCAGYRVGLYTSPHMHRLTERLQINGKPIAEDIWLALFQHYWPRLHDLPLSFFEAMTCLAFAYFAKEKCDCMVIEVGLGGRYDATNIITPKVSAMTSIGLDHQAFLGDTLDAIAFEKAGIIKAKVPVIVGPCDALAEKVIAQVAQSHNAPCTFVGHDAQLQHEAAGLLTSCLGQGEHRLDLSRHGAHQLHNIACVVGIVAQLRQQGWSIAHECMQEAMTRWHWPGRMERLPGPPECWLDAAHNLQGCLALKTTLEHIPKASRTVLVFACMQDKDAKGMLATLSPVVDVHVLTEVQLARSMPAHQLRQSDTDIVITNPIDALTYAMTQASPEGRVIIAGSVFLVAHLRAHLLGIEQDPPIAL